MTQADRQPSWPEASSVESPCVRRCTLDEDDLCVGCGRMLREILEWSAAPAFRQIEIRSAAAARLEQRRLRLQS